MNDTQLLLQIVLAGAFFLVAIALDLYYHRIPNLLCLCAIFCGFAVNGYFAQLNGVLMAMAGFALAFGVLFPVFVLRVLGAGDIKLMMGIGALMGPKLLMWSLLYGITAGAVTTLLLVLWQVGFRGVFTTIKRYWLCVYYHVYFRPEAGEAAGQKVPYAPALAIGWVWACSLDNQVIELYGAVQHWIGGV
ncbi:prepilin peptidase [Shewanella yunxiaonensis]|uniref:Prepilin peptidase n=1 Tax=Shewanella yunxiaonensis TaxID=2829809 RepID=A0ABX7YW79_9GAMM|nr:MULTISPECIES: A24 family peptidase [Shewanella]MDF0535665.1 A24 family peptidase [Shewanella sp. A32]QUN06944.1 prepilin peptidase [Shewanella yunxiaonensis]